MDERKLRLAATDYDVPRPAYPQLVSEGAWTAAAQKRIDAACTRSLTPEQWDRFWATEFARQDRERAQEELRVWEAQRVAWEEQALQRVNPVKYAWLAAIDLLTGSGRSWTN